MKISNIAAGTVLILISAEEKRKIFETDITGDNGLVISLVTSLKAGSDTDEHFSQSVQLGEVIAIADDVDNMVVGDIVVLDYIADAKDDHIAYFDGEDKVISLLAKTCFHTDSKMVFASMKTRRDTYSWREGDVDKLSLIYGFYRDGLLVPNDHYIFLEHKNLTWEGTTPGGITYWDHESDNTIRRVIAAAPGGPYKTGDLVLTQVQHLYERSIKNMNFDVVMVNDILGSMSEL